jgi:23S rRNA G2445 N2-methylase RlmL
MKAIAITLNNLEDVSIDEVKDILKVKARKILNERIFLEIKNNNSLLKLAKKTRTLKKVYILIKKFKFMFSDSFTVNTKFIF